MQIAPTARASVAARDNAYAQSIPAMAEIVSQVSAVGLICVKAKRPPTEGGLP
jgi:hypothetical protein